MEKRLEEKDKKYLTSVMKHLKKVEQSKRLEMLNIHNYEFIQYIGKGHFSTVYLARHKQKSFELATKVVNKDLYGMEGREVILQEARNQYWLRHPNVLRIFGIFEGYGKLFLFLEYAALGSLRNHLENALRFSDSTAGKVAHDIVGALHYCHEQKVIHRDLKPDNVLVTRGQAIKLADFGCSAFSPNNLRETFCGTSYYVAPEILMGPYTRKVDNWSLGVMCYEFVTGRVPFDGKTFGCIIQKGRNQEVKTYPFMSAAAKDFILKLLRVPEERLSLTEAFHHPWIKGNMNTQIPFKDGFMY